MRALFYGVGAATLAGLALGGLMKPDLVRSATPMTPVEQGYAYDDGASYAPTVAPVYHDSWIADLALLQSASYDAGDADIPRYDPRPAPEDRAEAIRQAALQDNLSAPPPEQASVRYPSASGDILAGLTPHMPIPPLPARPSATPAPDRAVTGDTRPAPPAPS